MDGDKGGRAQLFKPVSLCSDSSITVMSFFNLHTKNHLDDIAVALRVLTTLTERKFVTTDGQCLSGWVRVLVLFLYFLPWSIVDSM